MPTHSPDTRATGQKPAADGMAASASRVEVREEEAS